MDDNSNINITATNANPSRTIPDDSILYQRQDTLGINRDQSVAVIGAGGVGSWVTLFLGLAGVNNITVYDSDEVDGHNLNRLPYGPDMLGKSKAMAITEHINKLRPGCSIIPRGHFNPDLHYNNIRQYHWVICGTDSLKSRRMIYEQVDKSNKETWSTVQYIEIGADGTRATVSFNPPDFSSPDEDNPGYASVPVFVGPCTLAASIVAYYVLLGGPIPDMTHLVEWDNRANQVRLVTDGGYDYSHIEPTELEEIEPDEEMEEVTYQEATAHDPTPMERID